MKLSLPPKLVEKLVWVAVIWFCKIFIPSWVFDAPLCWNWLFTPPNGLTLCITLFYDNLLNINVLAPKTWCGAVCISVEHLSIKGRQLVFFVSLRLVLCGSSHLKEPGVPLNLFEDFLGGGLNSVFLIFKLLGLILEHFFKFKNLWALLKNQVWFHVHTTNSLTLKIVWVQNFRIILFYFILDYLNYLMQKKILIT